MRSLFFSTVCLIYTFTIADVGALMCYECNTLLDLECFNLTKMSIHYRPCEPRTMNHSVTEYRRPLCRKIRQKIYVRNNLVVTKHSCGWELLNHNEDDICHEIRDDDAQQMVCQCFTDGCNSSGTQAANYVLVAGISTLSLWHMYLGKK